MRSPNLRFKLRDLTRAVLGVTAAGQKVREVSIDTDGRITMQMGAPTAVAGDKDGENECDARLKELETAAGRSPSV